MVLATRKTHTKKMVFCCVIFLRICKISRDVVKKYPQHEHPNNIVIAYTGGSGAPLIYLAISGYVTYKRLLYEWKFATCFQNCLVSIGVVASYGILTCVLCLGSHF